MLADNAIWLDLVASNQAYLTALQAFRQPTTDRVALVKHGQRPKAKGIEVVTALGLVPQMDVAERLQILDDLLR